MNILVADSGSTKTTWCFIDDCTEQIVKTQGINPFQQDESTIKAIFTNELLPQLNQFIPSDIFFYGAGCTIEKSPIVQNCRGTLFPKSKIEVHGDLLGAARALYQHNEGIACILGTGSNSCLYNGHEIVANTPPLGFILGDEGSGAYMGKRLVADMLKGKIKNSMKNKFFDTYQLRSEERRVGKEC